MKMKFLFSMRLSFFLWLNLFGMFVLEAHSAEASAIYGHFLKAHPAIASAIGIHDEEARQSLYALLDVLENTGKLPDPSPEHASRKAPLHALNLRRAAFCLWVDHHGRVPWKLAAYSEEDLKLLLSYDETLLHPVSSTYIKLMQGIDVAFNHGIWVKASQKESIDALGLWIREHVTHLGTGSHDAKSMEEYLLGGSIGSCQSVGDFVAVVATAMNIPCRTARYPDGVTNWTGHRYIDFPSDERFLVHGDNFYNRALLDAPVPVIFDCGPARREIFRILKEAPDQLANHTNQRSVELYLEYGRDPKLIAAAGEGAEAVYALLDKDFSVHARGGDGRVHYLEPIRENVMDAIDRKLASIRARQPGTATTQASSPADPSGD